MRRPRLHSRASKPLGSITTVWKATGRQVRKIKVKMDGPKAQRWIEYARWWWEQNRGAVPPNKRVCHLDGNSLNDDPSNFGLLTAGDVVFLSHERDPEMSRRNFRKLREATAKMNRLRGQINRETHWLPWSWYGVDCANKRIYNRPQRKCCRVYGDHGMQMPSNPRLFHSAALGFPDQSLAGACVLTVLIEQGPATARQLLERVTAFQLFRGWRTLSSTKSVIAVVCRLKAAVLHRRLGGRLLYQISDAGRASRQTPCEVVSISGNELTDERFAGFERVSPAQEAEAA